MDQLEGAIIAIVVTILLVFISIGIIILVLSYQKKQALFIAEKEKQVMESKLEAQEQTLKKVSEELHDNIGQVLTLAKLNINSLDPGQPQDLVEKIGEVKQLISNAIHDLRNLSKSLNPDYAIDHGLVAAIESEVKRAGKLPGCSIQFCTEGTPYELSSQHEFVLFRIFQEVLTNIIKHSQGSVVIIVLQYNLPEFVLVVTDNGIGFHLPSGSGQGNGYSGSGLRNMQSRAQLIGARFDLETWIGKGTTVKVSLPMHAVMNKA
jgi:two-component system NarL family sensor kinase